MRASWGDGARMEMTKNRRRVEFIGWGAWAAGCLPKDNLQRTEIIRLLTQKQMTRRRVQEGAPLKLNVLIAACLAQAVL